MVSTPYRTRATFSAIIPNYNHGKFVLGAISAAIEQTVPFDEIIIIDDASTDNSVELIKERIRDVPHAKLVENSQNIGVINSCNRGLEAATGDFLFFMSADDGYSPHIIEWCHGVLQSYPHIAMISGNTRICNEVTGTERAFNLPFPQHIGCYGWEDIAALSKKQAFTFNIGANVLRRSSVIAAGEFLEPLKWHCDWFLYLLLAARETFAVVPYEFARIRQADSQYSNACFHWKKQRPVIEAFMDILRSDYPRDYPRFRECAMLPTYDLQTLALAIKNRNVRGYMTPMLLWRLLSYKPLRVIGRLCPEHVRSYIRQLVRV